MVVARNITWGRYCSKQQQTGGLEQAAEALARMRAERLMDTFEEVALPVGECSLSRKL